LSAKVCQAKATSTTSTTDTKEDFTQQQVEDRYERGVLILQARQESAKL
jgi:hypothetical protein